MTEEELAIIGQITGLWSRPSNSGLRAEIERLKVTRKEHWIEAAEYLESCTFADSEIATVCKCCSLIQRRAGQLDVVEEDENDVR